ncbi:MAG: SPOR domain-containing protein, partial [Gammaproteobacteria bacterium]|nr:SPOR domain-containing protein [Gammaproteobacteria bacterium]
DAGDEVKKPAESTSKTEIITAEHALADNIQRNLAAAKEGDVFWALNLSSVYQKRAPVNRLLERIRSTGIPAEIKAVFINSSKWYRIRVFGFSNYAEAQGFMQEVTDKTDIEKYWISQVVVDSAYLKNLADKLPEIDN